MAYPTVNSTPQLDVHAENHSVYIDVKLHAGAVGDGVTDDTAAFDEAADAAAGGGTIFIPPGTYVLTNWTPPGQCHIVGSGVPPPVSGSPINYLDTRGGTILKAGTGAEWVVKFIGSDTAPSRFCPSVRDLAIDGNNHESSGLLIQGANSRTVVMTYIQQVEFYQCIVGLKFGNYAPVNQNDKNTLIHCRWDENDTALWLEPSNSQLTKLIGGLISGSTTAINMSGGGLTWIGGSIESSTTGIKFTGPNLDQVTLIDFISEGYYPGTDYTDIDATDYWPLLGVTLDSCIMQSTSDACVRMTGPESTYNQPPILRATNTVFAKDILGDYPGATFIDTLCDFGYAGASAAWVPTADYSCRRLSTYPKVGGTRFYTITEYGGSDGDEVLSESDGRTLTLGKRLNVPTDGTAWLRGETATIVSDNFNRADAGVLGGSWSVSGTSVWGIASNQAKWTSTGDGDPSFATLDSGLTNITVSANITLSSGSSGAGLVVRGDGTDYIYAELVYVGPADYGLLLKAWQPGDLGDYEFTRSGTPVLAPSDTYALSVTIDGNDITVSVDGTQHIAYTMTDAEANGFTGNTYVGMSVYWDVFEEDGGSRWDNFVASVPPTLLQITSNKLVMEQGLAVGNSAAATTLGTVTDKMEVFDSAGASIGFVPIYDAIT